MECQLLIPRGNGTALLQEADVAFDDAPTAVAHHIVADWPTASAPTARSFGRNDRRDVVVPQPHPNALRVIGPIAAQVARALARVPSSPSDAHARSDGLELG